MTPLLQKGKLSLFHEEHRRLWLQWGEALVGPLSLHWALGEKERALGWGASLACAPSVSVSEESVSLCYIPRDGLSLTLSLSLCEEGLLARVSCKLTQESAPTKLSAVWLSLAANGALSGLGQREGWRFFPLGYSSFSPSFALDSRAELTAPLYTTPAAFSLYTHSVYWNDPETLSTPWAAFFHPVGQRQAFLLGFLSAKKGLGEIALRRQGSPWIEARLSFGDRLLSPGEELQAEPFVLWQGDAQALLERYLDEVSQQTRPRRTSASVPSGWCSWYYYYTKFSEQDLRQNLEALSTSKDLPVQYIQLDDGYQTKVGDWLSLNQKFPSGLATLAQDIKAKGFSPGIWLAPFFVQRGSQIYQQKRHWLLQNSDGELCRLGYHPLWGVLDGQVYSLDLTHPEVLQFLTEVFTSLVSAGFEYFKIDFLFAGLVPGRAFDPTKSPVEAYRQGLATIRAAIGDRFLLGCGAPLLPSVGFVDAMRISPDVKEAWEDDWAEQFAKNTGYPSAENALVNCITRAPLHQKLWLNDPDCLLVRKDRTSLTVAEVQTLVTVLSLTGGMLFLSDDIQELDSERRRLASLALPPLGAPAKGLGFSEERRPWRFVRAHHEGALAALINWSDELRELLVSPEEVGLAPGEYHAYSFFGGEYKRLQKGERLFALCPRHGVALLLLTPVLPRPQLISVTHHLGQLTTLVQEERWENHTLYVRLLSAAQPHGEIFLSVPPGFVFIEALSSGGVILHRTQKTSYGYLFETTLTGPGLLQFKFLAT